MGLRSALSKVLVGTLRQALQQLEAEGLVYRENRRGWFVSPRRTRYDPTRISAFMDHVSTQGRSPRTECLQAQLRPAGDALSNVMETRCPGT
jgi:DNA-binding GntR family transcriptional regulator